MFGIDYTSPGGLNIPAAKKGGVKFVCRYLTPPGADYNFKRLVASEVRNLRRAGISLVFVFETSAKRSLGGRAAGIADARASAAHLKSVGVDPSKAVVFFAVDFDASASQQAAINAYLEGAGSVLGPENVGVYGGYYVVRRALDAGVCAFGWQTYAWSGGLIDKVKATIRFVYRKHIHRGAHIYQYSNSHRAFGVGCDFDRTLQDGDYGQWPRPKSTKSKLYVVKVTDAKGKVHTVATPEPWVLGHKRFSVGKFPLKSAEITLKK